MKHAKTAVPSSSLPARGIAGPPTACRAASATGGNRCAPLGGYTLSLEQGLRRVATILSSTLLACWPEGDASEVAAFQRIPVDIGHLLGYDWIPGLGQEDLPVGRYC